MFLYSYKLVRGEGDADGIAYLSEAMGHKPCSDMTANEVDRLVRLLLKDQIDVKEHVVALYLGPQKDVLGCEVVSVGDDEGALINIRHIARTALYSGATGVVLAHNHVHGGSEPSAHDLRETRALSHGLRLVGVQLLDHIVVGKDDFSSIRWKRSSSSVNFVVGDEKLEEE